VKLRAAGDRNFDLDTGFEGDGSDLLDNLAGRVQVDQALVDLELVAIPGLGTFTARSLAGGDLQDLGGQADGALDAKLLVLCAVNEISAELFEVANVGARERNTNFVNFGRRNGAGGIIVLFSLGDVTHRRWQR